MDFESICESIEKQIEIEFTKLINMIQERKENILKKLDLYKKGIIKSKFRIDERRKQFASSVSKDEVPLHNEVSEVVNRFSLEVEGKMAELKKNEFRLGQGAAFNLEVELLEHQLSNIGVLKFEAIYSQPDSITQLDNNPLHIVAYSSKKENRVYLVTAHNEGITLDTNMKVLSVDTLPKPPQDIKARNFGGIACSKEYLFVSLTNENQIAVFTREWKLIQNFGEYGSGKNQLSGPRGLCHSDKKLYVCEYTNSRVQVFKNGTHAGFIGQASKSGQVFLPTAVCTNQRGQILVLHKGNPCVNMYDTNGDLVRQLGSYLSGMGAEYLEGLCVTNENQILITSLTMNRVYIYSEDANSCVVLGRSNGKGSSDPGTFDLPIGICMTPQGCVAVCDHNNSRIQLFQLDMVQSLFY